MAEIFNYSIFGLRVQSDLQLPELFPVADAAGSDVTVRLGAIPGEPGFGPGAHAHQGGVLLVVEDVGSYWVAQGSRIVVEPRPGAPEQNVRLYLLGSVLGILIHQRGLLPLHANCVEIEELAFAFMGSSGAGKSTLAAWFHDRGYRIVADDVSVISFDESGQPMVCPGVPRLRLWREALEASGRNAEHHPRSWHGDESYDKYDVSISPDSAVCGPRPLAGIYLLGESERPSIELLQGLPAAEAIFANTYRGAYVPMAKSSREHWSACVQVVRSTPVFLAGRRLGFEHFEAQCDRMLAHSRAISARHSGAARISV